MASPSSFTIAALTVAAWVIDSVTSLLKYVAKWDLCIPETYAE